MKYCSFYPYDLLLIIEKIFFSDYFYCRCALVMDITVEKISSGNAFSLHWLRERGLKLNIKCLKLLGKDYVARFMNTITPANATWNGCNASALRTDLLAVNGFNEEMHYGGQDRELGERLRNNGLRPIQIRFSAIALHLDHKRPYKTRESVEKNRQIIQDTRHSGIIETPYGIKQLH